MANISVNYLGLELKSPFIVASSGLTADVEKVKQMEIAGAGAVVIKSLFEEQINNETEFLSKESLEYPEMADYLQGYVRQNSISKYLDHITELKKSVSIPVIASINCFSKGEWLSYARNIEAAGADALEINIYALPFSINVSSQEMEDEYYDVVRSIVESVKIPIAVKIGRHFTNIPAFVHRLAGCGARAVVMFNRFYSPDIDLENLKLIPASPLSDANEYRKGLRWVAITSSIVKNIDYSISTGIHTPESAIKSILVGGKTVQLCSVLYQEGIDKIAEFNTALKAFMDKQGYEILGDMRGKLSYANFNDPASFERVQFMKVYK